MPKPYSNHSKKAEENTERFQKALQSKMAQSVATLKTTKVEGLSNLVDAARFVEKTNSSKITKKAKPKPIYKGKERGKEKKSHRESKHLIVEDTDADDETSDIESEVESDSQLALLKKSVSEMMAKIQRLESKRKRKKMPKKAHLSDYEDSSDEDVKPKKPLKKESSPPTKPINANQQLTMHSQQMMQMQQQYWQMQQMMNMYSNPSINPAGMMPSMPFMTTQHQQQPSFVNMNSKSASNTLRFPKTKKPNAETRFKDSSKIEDKKSRKSVEGEAGEETDASEVYAPTAIKDPINEYLGKDPFVPTPSFISFVDDITKDEKTVQSTVVSSTKRAAETSKVPGSDIPRALFQRNDSITNTQQISATNQGNPSYAGILMNLFPTGKPNPLEIRENDKRSEEINTVLRSMIGYNPVDAKPKQPKRFDLSADRHTHSKPLFQNLLPISKHSQSPIPSDNAPESKRFVDNATWLRECSKKMDLQDQEGDTILHILIAKEETPKAIEVIKKMQHLPSLDILNALGQTPLHLAMYTKNLPVVKELLQHGSDVSLVDAHGNNPLHIACEENSIEMLEIVFNEGLSHYQTATNTSAMITTLAPEYFHIINARNNQGLAALHIAAKEDNEVIIKFLGERGAEMNNQEGRSGNTPLLIALMKNNWKMASFLLERFVNVNIPNFSNFYPLHFAVQGNHVEMVKALLSRGAEMGSRANDYDQNANTTEIKQLLAKEMRRRRRNRIKLEPKSQM
ncbi:uncharacterized protein [Clytia hemisphaerica]|uniref:Uncharacterized protein n=1 Tax=Clytia hemisphaerica TaxID=252671 RepID=A0A7M5X8T9_9CNID|eukprot:TCONS_00046043-protein